MELSISSRQENFTMTLLTPVTLWSFISAPPPGILSGSTTMTTQMSLSAFKTSMLKVSQILILNSRAAATQTGIAAKKDEEMRKEHQSE